MPGPPVLIYLLLAGAPPRTARATLLAFFALIYAATLAAHAATIGIPAQTWLSSGTLIPFAILGGLGRAAARRSAERRRLCHPRHFSARRGWVIYSRHSGCGRLSIIDLCRAVTSRREAVTALEEPCIFKSAASVCEAAFADAVG
jgi:hypothetical protein